jgi:hypothetical protein
MDASMVRIICVMAAVVLGGLVVLRRKKKAE